MKFIKLFSLLLLFNISLYAQNCPQVTGLFTDNYSFNSIAAFVDGHWDSMLQTDVVDLSIKYKHVDSLQWNNLGMNSLDSSSTNITFPPLEHNSTYVWTVIAYCSENFQDAADWAVIDTFTTLEYVACPAPQNTYTNNIIVTENVGFANANWESMLGMGVDHFRLNFKLIDDTNWTLLANMDSTFTSRTMGNLSHDSYYEWRIRSYCSENQSYYSDWSVADTFYIGNFIPTDFSPEVSISLSNDTCYELSDISFSISQDTNEPDIQSSITTSNSGSFDISNLSIGQNIGSAVATAGINGFINNQYQLLVNEIIDENQAEIALFNSDSLINEAYFTIQNSLDSGIIISIISPADNNSYTSGNSIVLILTDIFLNPSPQILQFNTTIFSESSEDSSFVFEFEISCDNNFLAELESSIDFYPNPSSSFVYVSLKGQKKIRIFDLSGRELKNIQTTKDYFDVSILEKGVYIIEINSNVMLKKLVVG